MILEDQNSIGSQAWEDRKEELDREIARHEATSNELPAASTSPSQRVARITGTEGERAYSASGPGDGLPVSPPNLPEPAGKAGAGHGAPVGVPCTPLSSAPAELGNQIVVGVGDLPSSGVDTAPTASFPTSFLPSEAAFVLGISYRTLRELIERDHCTVLRNEDGVRFITLAQLDRLDDLIGIVEREVREAA